MRRIIMLALVALTMVGGVAAADRGRFRDHRSGGVYVQTSRPRFPRSYTYYNAPRYSRFTRPTYYPRYTRRPIYIQRPIIRHRYFDYYQRPVVIVENHPAINGYYWVPGQWT